MAFCLPLCHEWEPVSVSSRVSNGVRVLYECTECEKFKSVKVTNDTAFCDSITKRLQRKKLEASMVEYDEGAPHPDEAELHAQWKEGLLDSILLRVKIDSLRTYTGLSDVQLEVLVNQAQRRADKVEAEKLIEEEKVVDEV